MTQKDWDSQLLRQCLKLAEKAAATGEVPVGALIANSSTGEVISTAYNLKEKIKSPLGHAEVIATHRACKALDQWRLTGFTLYSSLEPCVMCSGVLLQARLDRIVWSAKDQKGGGESLFGLLSTEELNHQPILQSGEFAEESASLLKNFFSCRR